MAGWKDFAFEVRQRPTPYTGVTPDHVGIFATDEHVLFAKDEYGNSAHWHMGHVECVSGSTSWRGNNTNEFWGNDSGKGNSSGSNNTGVGRFSLTSIVSGNGNSAFGTFTLSANISGSYNVGIGHGAGFFETGSNKLYIHSSQTPVTSAGTLIYGDFATGFVRVGGNLQVANWLSAGKLLFPVAADGIMGTVVLMSGQATVFTTRVTTLGSNIFLTAQDMSGSPGFLYKGQVVDNVSFTVLSTSPTDYSTVAWLLVDKQ